MVGEKTMESEMKGMGKNMGEWRKWDKGKKEMKGKKERKKEMLGLKIRNSYCHRDGPCVRYRVYVGLTFVLAFEV
jgi:hypothetical protein